jgi:hypothetical protein
MRRRLATGLALVLVLAAVAAAFTMSGVAVQDVHDAVSLAVDPAHFRQAKFRRFSDAAGQEVYLLGTLHGRHLTTRDYSLLHLQAVSAHLRPDLVLVESRPEELAQDNWADGPIEMPFASLLARENGVEVRGFDWWTMDATHQINGDRREDAMFQNIRAGVADHKTTLILTGYAHVDGFERRLLANGWRRADFPDAEKQRLFDTTGQRLVFPRGMTHYVQKRIEIDRQTLAHQTDAFWRNRLTEAIAARQRLLRTITAVGERGS